MKIWIFIPSIISGTAGEFVAYFNNSLRNLNGTESEWDLWKCVGEKSKCCEECENRNIIECKDSHDNTQKNVLLIIEPKEINYNREESHLNPNVGSNLLNLLKEKKLQDANKITIWLHTSTDNHASALERQLKSSHSTSDIKVFQYSTLGSPDKIKQIADIMNKLIKNCCQEAFE